MLTWGLSLATRVFGALVLRGLRLNAAVCLFCISSVVALLTLHLQLSLGCYQSWLVEHGVYEVNTAAVGGALSWYLLVMAAHQRCFIFSYDLRILPSVERQFRNARWLERESGEMHDVWFHNKRDRRALYLVPLLYWAPLRKTYPVSGFYELRVCAGDGRLYPTHVSWLD